LTRYILCVSITLTYEISRLSSIEKESATAQNCRRAEARDDGKNSSGAVSEAFQTRAFSPYRTFVDWGRRL